MSVSGVSRSNGIHKTLPQDSDAELRKSNEILRKQGLVSTQSDAKADAQGKLDAMAWAQPTALENPGPKGHGIIDIHGAADLIKFMRAARLNLKGVQMGTFDYSMLKNVPFNIDGSEIDESIFAELVGNLGDWDEDELAELLDYCKRKKRRKKPGEQKNRNRGRHYQDEEEDQDEE